MHDMNSNLALKRTIATLLHPRRAAFALLAPGLAFAGPTGEDVVGGTVDIIRPDANNTVVNQYTDRAAINWQTFNVDADEFVFFNQPGASSIVLNRVLGGDASYILGHIESNGQVFLLNPQGVYFTHGASLDVQGFLASTLDMDPAEFMAGNFTLARSDNAPATAQVINDGTITAGPGGYVVLAGDYTENTGIITANAGSIALVSGNALTLDIEGDGLVNFAVDEATLSEAAGVRNAGSLIADGGRVIMTAKVANDLVATAVNNEGLVRARSIEERNGEIYLVGHGGDVANSGTLDADGENADGGTIIAYSDRDITLADGGVQTAAGDSNYSGGFMRFIAEERLDYQAQNTIRATGGLSGGFVEVSGHGSINLRGIPEIGPGGELLIDPQHVAIRNDASTPTFASSGTGYTPIGLLPSYVGVESITAVGAGYIASQLDAGVTVTLVASEAIWLDTNLSPVTIGATGSGDLNLVIGTVGSAAGASSQGNGGFWNGSGGQVPIINPSVDPDVHQIDLGDLNLNINGNVNIDAGTTGTVAIGSITAPGSVTLTGSSISVGSGFNGIASATSVTINGNVTGTNLLVGSSTNGVNQITINGNLNLSSFASLHALNSAGDINITGSINAASGIWLNAQGSFTSAGNITVAGPMTAGSTITLSANGPGGEVTLGSYASAGGNIDINAISTGFNGGNVSVAGALNAAGTVNINANGGSISGGGISAGSISGSSVNVFSSMSASVGPGVTINGPVVATTGNAIFNVTNTAGSTVLTLSNHVTANGSVDFNVSGPALSTIFINGDVRANNGNIHFGSQVDAISYGTGLHEIKAGGNISINGAALNGSAGFVDYIAGGNFTYNNAGGNPGTFAARDITLGGNLQVNAIGSGLHIVRDITAGHIDMHFTGSNSPGGNSLDVSINSLRATGTGTGNHDVVLEVHDVAGGFASNASIALGDISTAQGEVAIRAFGFGDGADVATVTTGNISTQRFLNIETPGDITTGSISVTRTGGPVSVDLRAFRDSGSLNGGDIMVNGNITASGRAAASNGHAASVHLETLSARNITVTGNVDITGTGRNFLNPDTGSNGFMGAVAFTARASNGTVDIGNVSLDGVGEAWLEVQGSNVALGDMTLAVADGSYTRDFSFGSTWCGTTCNISGQERLISGGRAEININNSGPTAGADATFGNITIDAPSAHVAISGYAAISGSSISVRSTGQEYEVSSAGTYNGVATSLNQTNIGGDTSIWLDGSSAGVVRLSGDVTLAGQGRAGLWVQSGTIKVRGLDVSASAGTFTRSGDPAPLHDNGPFDGGGSGPNIDTGTIVGATAQVSLSGWSSFGSSHVGANLVEIAGPVSVSGAGDANFRVAADNVSVTGNIDVTATHAQQDGSYAYSYTNSAGDLVKESGSVLSNWGHAGADISGNGNVSIAGLAVTGPTAHAHLEGVNIRTGAIDVDGSGGSLDVDETSVVNGVTRTLQLDAPNLLTGLALFADNTLNVTGAITLDAVGVGGLLMTGSTISTRDITLNVTAGDYTIKAPPLAGGALTDYSLGNAIFGVYGGTAAVNGNINITAGTQAHLGGNVNASGDFTVNANNGVTRAIPAVVQFLNGVDSDDSDATIAVPAALNVNANNIRINAGGGRTTLAGTLDADGALAIISTGTLNLANTTLNAGAGSFTDLPGDTRFLSLLAGEEVAVPTSGPSLYITGRNVALGNVATSGEYVFLQADALSISGTVTTSDPDLLLQVAPFATGTGFGLEQTSGRGTSYVYNGTLDAFNAATIALGTTAHTGNVDIGRNGGVNIGDTNLFVLTSGSVTGLDLVTSSGIVKDLFTLINGEFSVPQTDEIDTSQDLVLTLNEDYALEAPEGDEEEEGDEEGEDTDTETDVEEDDDTLIRQDTVDEEMMCR